MDRLLDNFGPGGSRWPYSSLTTFPAVNVWDAGDTLCVEAEVKEGVLTLHLAKTEQAASNIHSPPFQRTWQVPG